jgi:hypothetical protein
MKKLGACRAFFQKGFSMTLYALNRAGAQTVMVSVWHASLFALALIFIAAAIVGRF